MFLLTLLISLQAPSVCCLIHQAFLYCEDRQTLQASDRPRPLDKFQYRLLYKLSITHCHLGVMGICVYPAGSHKSICGLSDTGIMLICAVIPVSVSNFICFLYQLCEGLTISLVSSLRDGSVSVSWGLRAESLLLLTSRGVSVENTNTNYMWR